MSLCAGIDVGSSAVKAVIVGDEGRGPKLLAEVHKKIRKREVADVLHDAYDEVRKQAAVSRLDYVATTGEGEDAPFATGHFYGMTTHARGGLFLVPSACAVLDVGALHARAVSMDSRGKVLDYKMTSQCASGSGQFLESISRYLGVAQSEVGPLSRSGRKPERPSSICAVLAETDVINMVSRGISTPDILRGIHESMAGRFAALVRSLAVSGTVLLTGGLAADEGLLAAINDELAADPRAKARPLSLVAHPLSVYAGALGAALWGAVRHAKTGGVAWTANA